MGEEGEWQEEVWMMSKKGRSHMGEKRGAGLELSESCRLPRQF